jgi:hypothetical protein
MSETKLNLEGKLNGLGYNWFKLGVDNTNFKINLELPKFRYFYKNKKSLMNDLKNISAGFSVSLKFS